ncbi:hypothetical protein B5S31_g4403 [[Candida] boidinii]|nr:hypothetical protein B5S29_g513 [[Candida] boidinii]OWB74595.1 hypothetical protein B5S31_g4403 [[Candida] boidinii]OWB76499.1 hypothetical protein B5S32_g651 [[Candida] boidinii]
MVEEKSHPIRVFIGSVSGSITADDLGKRLVRYGKVEKEIEKHQKPAIDTWFGYATLYTTDKEFKKLRKDLNGMSWKGAKLVIDKAKPDFKTEWEKDSRRQDTKIKQRRIRERLVAKRAERISHRDEVNYNRNVIPGRMRVSKRKADFKKLLLKVNVKGVIKMIRCRKTKLWGFDKSRTARDLVARFVNGEWRDGTDHVVDRLTVKKFIQHAQPHDVADLFGIDMNEDKANNANGEEGIDEDQHEEREKNNKLLESLLAGFDFDRPVEVEEKEEGAGKDYEYGGIDAMDEDNYNNGYNANTDKNCNVPSQKDIVAEYESNNKAVVSFDDEIDSTKSRKLDEDEESDDEFYNKLVQKSVNESENLDGSEQQDAKEKINESKKQDKSHKEESNKGNKNDNNDIQDEDVDTEFLPTFGAKSSKEGDEDDDDNSEDNDKDDDSSDDSSDEEDSSDDSDDENEEDKADDSEEEEFIPSFGGSNESANENKTEALRALLNPVESESSGLFTAFAEEDDDIDKSKQIFDEKDIIKPGEIESQDTFVPPPVTNKNLGLFFTHFDSPFYSAQAQISKFPLINVQDKLNYDNFFFEQRGEMNREFRRRRRDALRQTRKKTKVTLI